MELVIKFVAQWFYPILFLQLLWFGWMGAHQWFTRGSAYQERKQTIGILTFTAAFGLLFYFTAVISGRGGIQPFTFGLVGLALFLLPVATGTGIVGAAALEGWKRITP